MTTLSTDFAHSLGLLRRFGVNAFSGCLLYDGVVRIPLTQTDGFVGCLDSRGVLVALGEPVCAPERYGDAVREFIDLARGQRKQVAFIAVGEAFLEAAMLMDPTWLRLGEEFIYDVPTYAPRGNPAKKVRSARNRLLRTGAQVREVDLGDLLDAPFQDRLHDVVGQWLRGKGAFQARMLDLDLFKLGDLKRYFYVECDGRPLGFLTCLPIFGRQGFLLEDLVRNPAAPLGTTETLVLEAIRVFRAEGYRMATFGLSPKVNPAQSNLTGASRLIAATAVCLANRVTHLDRLHHYRKKYHTGASEPRYLVKFPSGIGFRDVWGILHAFNLA
jgi:phosphatidylglycerol lysyltransferase